MLVGGYTHWLEIVLKHVVDVCFVGFLAKNDANRGILAGQSFVVVKNSEIGGQLPQIRWFELSFLELHDHERLQFTIEEEQVYPMVVTELVVVYLMAFVGEGFSKGHDEVLDIHHNLALYHILVHINGIGDVNVLYIDVVEQIGIFEHLQCAQGECLVGNCFEEIVWQACTMTVGVGFYHLLQIVHLQALLVCQLDLVFPLIILFGVTENGYMVRERYVEKCRNRKGIVIGKLQLLYVFRMSRLQFGSRVYRIVGKASLCFGSLA